MGFDLCFWDSGSGSGTAQEIYNDVCEGVDDRLLSSDNVLRFRSELLDHWISLNDAIQPLEYDPDLDEQEDLDRYVLITVPPSLFGELSEIIKLARSFGLIIYDPQTDQALSE